MIIPGAVRNGFLAGAFLVLAWPLVARADVGLPGFAFDAAELGWSNVLAACVLTCLAVMAGGAWTARNPQAAAGVLVGLIAFPVFLIAFVVSASLLIALLRMGGDSVRAVQPAAIGLAFLIALALGACMTVGAIRLAWNRGAFRGFQLVLFVLAAVLFGIAAAVASQGLKPARRGPPPAPPRPVEVVPDAENANLEELP